MARSLSCERSQDYKLIRSIVTHPRIYRHHVDDFSAAAEEFTLPESAGFWYIVVRDRGDVLGCFVFHPHNAATWWVHTCLLPEAWGQTAKEAAAAARDWIWEHTTCRRIRTEVPAFNRLALRFAQACGMQPIGTDRKSYLKDGVLHDLILLGISKPE